jgi:PadR family transcriptional regulator
VAPDEHDTQLLKGVLILVLLRLLTREESYGYQLVGRVHAAGLTGVAEGSVYPALARLERDGYLSTELVATSSGPPRKYFRLSPSGVEFLNARTAAWRSLASIVDQLLDEPAQSRQETVA